MDSQDRQFMRAIVRRVHPDLFVQHPFERQRNSESLKILNRYVDEILDKRRGNGDESTVVEFYVKEENEIYSLKAELPGYGSLGPLFFAFGFITEEELQQGRGRYFEVIHNTDFLQWLQETVEAALETATQHEALKHHIRDTKADIEDRFGLVNIQLGGEFAVSTAEQKRQIEALQILDTCLAQIIEETGQKDKFDGFTVRLYHSKNCPYETYSWIDDKGEFNVKTGKMHSYIGEDGVLHVIADRSSTKRQIQALDLARARLLSKLSTFWEMRVQDLAPQLQQLLGVENVWCDTRNQFSQQKFVLWGGYVLEKRNLFKEALLAPNFQFSLLVHSDTSSPMVDFLPSSPVLQVRSDCQPEVLLDYLCSEEAEVADEAAVAVESGRHQEEELLEQVRIALNAKHVIRVCSVYDQNKAMDAALRLLNIADKIKQSVDLTGASIAIDDCYEVWESGTISIPYDFEVTDLPPKLQKLLANGQQAQQQEEKQKYDRSSQDSYDDSSFDDYDNQFQESNNQQYGGQYPFDGSQGQVREVTVNAYNCSQKVKRKVVSCRRLRSSRPYVSRRSNLYFQRFLVNVVKTTL
eukprot:TRINITY_DN670_c0_g1_i1.p1 TRINITY_DN670_c0_g1~~TRINITY_DN670_c0_g1_i1.p1  ORF type:complete len:580 (-),score=66.70 TRINITY_DN670_c0_g1_i1:565-2304(-)